MSDLVSDCRLAAKVLADMNEIETGQSILLDAADTITELRLELLSALGEAGANLDRAVKAERDAALSQVERMRVDPAEIEARNHRWHGEDVRVVSVRWEPYKPDGARQRGVKGRWQECVGSGDYWRWNNCERPNGLRALTHEETKL